MRFFQNSHFFVVKSADDCLQVSEILLDFFLHCLLSKSSEVGVDLEKGVNTGCINLMIKELPLLKSLLDLSLHLSFKYLKFLCLFFRQFLFPFFKNFYDLLFIECCVGMVVGAVENTIEIP